MARDDLTDWLDAALAPAGARRTGPVEEQRVRPWASVLHAPTTGGTVWLKAPGPESRYEVALYDVLVRHVSDYVLEPIAADVGRGLLLLPDGRHRPDADLRAALPAYADLQRRLANHVDELLAAGVPDMRPAALPERFDEALAYVVADERLRRLRPAVVEWCAELSATDVPASIDHNDLHGGNVLPGPRFYDWGDSCVAHPFASLLLPLQLSDPSEHDGLIAAYLDSYAIGDVATVRLACKVGLIARAHTWMRALGPDPSGPHASAVADHLALLLD